MDYWICSTWACWTDGETTVTAPTIKVRARRVGDYMGPASGQLKESPTQPKHQKGLIHKIMEIVSNDIKHPERIFQRERKVIMPESKESWKDWEGQI
jgi:hypothetical protein